MKERINIVLFWITSLICLSGIVVGIVGDSVLRSRQLCVAINVNIEDRMVNKFAGPKDIVTIIDKRYGGYVNVPVESIDLYRMEKLLLDVDFVESATCYLTRDGILNVEITQTTPVAKYMLDGTLTYMSAKGKFIKTKSDWKKDIVMLSGPARMGDRTWRKNLGDCCEKLLADAGGLGKRALTVECDEKGECVLLLKDREERFLLGKPVNGHAKLEKIHSYENKISKPYTSVDVRYEGQIICK